jgi:small subunit ribosomal protein S26e
MPTKRRNHGRNKNNKGHSDSVHCTNCYRLVAKDKAIKRFVIKNMVDASSKRDIEANSAYTEEEKYTMPRLYVKNEWCVACAIHGRIVRVRSGEDRRVRYVSKYRSDKRDELSTGLYRIANVRQGAADKKFKKTTEEEK